LTIKMGFSVKQIFIFFTELFSIFAKKTYSDGL
jgi:hypothetical protein